MLVKITMIGAVSAGFTRALVGDILSLPELVDAEFAFTDITPGFDLPVTPLTSIHPHESRGNHG